MPGQAEDERRAAAAERERLPRPDGDAPEVLLDPELRQDPAHEVVRADRDAARADEHVRGEPALERGSVRLLVVGDRADPLDDRARGLERRGQHRPVRLVDLARPELVARCAQLGTRAEDDDARSPARTATSATPAAASAPICAAPSTVPASSRTSPGANVASERPHVRAGRDGISDLDAVV